jgi:hypothetical protein
MEKPEARDARNKAHLEKVRLSAVPFAPIRSDRARKKC